MVNALIKSSYPQALAKLIVILKNIHLAEDFLQSAVEQALKEWPYGQPDNGVAWLIKVARNKYIDDYRRQQKQASFESLPELNETPNLSEQSLLLSYNDDLLRLIFTCCHPALNQETQITLALKHVLGLSIAQISKALLVNKKALEKRLARAKTKISVNKIQYEIPKTKHWPDRLSSVLKTIYLLFNEGYLTTERTGFIDEMLCREAIRLARLLSQCIKNDPQVIGLLALILQQAARTPARVDAQGHLILLSDQDRTLWRQHYIQEGNVLVEKSLRLGASSLYSLQAAIAALHNNATTSEATDWQQIYDLYQLQISLDKNPIIQLNAAVAYAEMGNISGAILKVKSLHNELKNYSYYRTTLAGLYFKNKQYEQGLKEYQQSINQLTNQHEITFVKKQAKACLDEINKRV